jgi:hypothetical protein
MFEEVAGQFMTKDRYLVPSMYSSLQALMKISVLYFILALYFDNVLSHNRGTA